MNVKCRQPLCSASLFLDQMIIFEDFNSKPALSIFLHLPDLPKRLYSMNQIYLCLLFTQINKLGSP